MAHDDCSESRSARPLSDEAGSGQPADLQTVLPTALEANTAAIHRLADGIGELVAAIRESVPLELIGFDEAEGEECGDCGSAADAGQTEQDPRPSEQDSRPALALLPQPRDGEHPSTRAEGCCQQERVAASRGRHAKPEADDADEQVGTARR